jgi:hypothetical protein
MIHALLWKEYRTQRMAWIALAFVGAASLLGLPAVMAPGGLEGHPDVRVSLQFLTGALAWTYGMICGAQLLAGEREMGTLPFLDTLPCFRRHLWFVKLLGGVLLLAAQVGVLLALAVAARLFENWTELAWTLYFSVCAGVYGLSWGLVFSAFGHGVMNMILLSLGAQLVVAFFTTIVNFILTGVVMMATGGLAPDSAAAFQSAVGGILALLTVPLALAVSAARFTRLDRHRLRALPELAAPSQTLRVRVAWHVLFWLTWRQARGFAIGMAAFALLLGLLVLLQGVLFWPLATLLVGVLCGATTFTDEQQGPFRFLGDQRLPMFQFWLVKVGLRFAIAAGAALVALLPSFFLALGRIPDLSEDTGNPYPFFAHAFHSPLVGPVCPTLVFLTAWLVSGFSAGCLCGLLFRHGLASGVFGLCLGTVLAGVWVPSMLEGGIQAWQPFGPPVLLLVATLPLLRPWAAGRIASWTTAKRLAPFAALATFWIVGGLAYRVWEIPDVALPYDLNAFKAGLPGADDNRAGELVRSACMRFESLSHEVKSRQAAPPAAGMAPGAPAAAGPPAPPGLAAPAVAAPALMPAEPPVNRAMTTLTRGWPPDDRDLDDWLDELFKGDWMSSLNEAADLPPGLVEDLRNATWDTPLRLVQPAREIGVVLAARGLQRQAAGDDAAFVENLRLGLGLARALRHHAPKAAALAGASVEDDFLSGLDRWMEHLNGRPDLLRKALGLLSAYLETAPADEVDQDAVDYLIAHNSLSDPVPWATASLYMEQGMRDWDAEAVGRQAQWVALTGLLIPWEHERQERVLRWLFADPNLTRRRDVVLWLGPVAMLAPYASNPSSKTDRECRERAMQLELALRLFQAENGRPARTLDEVVPAHLAAVPLDPYDGNPFRYRLSAGEQITWPAEPNPQGGPAQLGWAGREIPSGQGVLWSTGPNKTDDGGKRQHNSSGGPNSPGEDQIFLVPLPPKNN